MNTQLKQWKSTGSYFQYQGHNIFFRDSLKETNLKTKSSKTIKPNIDKPTLICIHGFPASSWDWHKLWPDLTENYHVIALDQLGFGFSDKPQDDVYSVLIQAEIIEALLQHLGIDEFHIVAHDFGTLIAQELIDRDLKRKNQTNSDNSHAPKPLSLLAMSGSIFPELSNPRLIQKLLISRFGFLISKVFNERVFQRNMKRVYAPSYLESLSESERDTLFKTYWQLLTYARGDQLLHYLNFFLKDRKEHGLRWANAWQATEIPIRYLAGEQDPMYGHEGIDLLLALSNKKEIYAIKNAGHFPHIEAPSEVLAQVTSFIENIKYAAEV